MRIGFRTSIFVGTALASGLAAPAFAQSDDAQNAIVVTGTRDPSQTVRNSVSPISVVSGEQLRATGKSDLQDALVQS